ncbi:small, acid-soluble spore protein, alpha/beta type [Paenibacillus sp. HJGM_3]|uniref:small, acid-soluble spore protein, alpha/beta type n=1 Tax=Paenibacillus sp. HJGM_3 TaxID=3379816 RepID=UPI00385DBA48
MARNNNNTLLVPQSQSAIDQLKMEAATTLGVNLGAETSSRQNGSVGGQITKTLVQIAEQSLAGRATR